MLKATRFLIIRDVNCEKRSATVPLREKPHRVCTLLDEHAFNDSNLLIHGHTVFFEDHLHDWWWRDGVLRYFTRVATKADVVIVYEEAEVSIVPLFDPRTGIEL